jgi:predicted GIY-YIG superfamily endonuclease
MDNRTYVGYTVNPQRRLRQHNGVIKGGARFTARKSNSSWYFLTIISSSQLTKNMALSLEWHIKHVKTGTGKSGRVNAVIQTLVNNNKFNDFSYQLYVSKTMSEMITGEKLTILLDQHPSMTFYNDIEEYINNILHL